LRAKYLFTFAVVTLLTSESSFAGCRDLFGFLKVPDFYSSPKLAPETQAEIFAALSDKTTPVAERLQNALQIYEGERHYELGLRDRLFTEDLRIQMNPDGKIEASGLKVSVPAEIEHTALALAILVHEREHRIQNRTEPENIAKLSQALLFPLEMARLARAKYFYEHGAIRSEWEFLHAVPKGLREEAVDRLRTVMAGGPMRRQLELMLTSADLPLDQYLKVNKSAGYYTYGAIVSSSPAFYGYVGGLGAFLLITRQLGSEASKQKDELCAKYRTGELEPSFVLQMLCGKKQPEGPAPAK